MAIVLDKAHSFAETATDGFLSFPQVTSRGRVEALPKPAN